MSLILSGDSGVTFPDNSTQAVGFYGFKNRIINGAMVIDQRNAGGSTVNGNGSTYFVDRWLIYDGNGGSHFTVQQNKGSVTPPVGYTNYLGLQTTTALSAAAGNNLTLTQYIEGFNTSDLGWGASGASSVTYSFWVRSSLTGTFAVQLQSGNGDAFYVFNYTINSANTWEQKTITIAGPTIGTWSAGTNNRSIVCRFDLGSGSTFAGTPNTWSASTWITTSGAVSLVGTLNATFYITGVQLEKGSTATSFDFRPYGTELNLCQRYYEKSYDIGTVPGTSTTVGLLSSSGVQGATSTGEITAGYQYKVNKRDTPTVTYYDTVGNSGKCTRVSNGVAQYTNSSVANNYNGTNNLAITSGSGTAASTIFIHLTASAEL